MDDELVALWEASDPAALGERLRVARRRANLTQGELGGDLASTGYVSRLESGTRRGDLALFSAFAERLGIDLRALLAGPEAEAADALTRLQLDYAELHLASGNIAEAEGCLALVPNPNDRQLPPSISREVRRLRAGIYEAQGRLSDAIDEGEQLVAGPTRDLRWVTDLIALSRCYRESGDLQRAISVGQQAEQEIERVGLTGSTEAIQLVLTVAAAYSDRGDVAYAVQLCREAARRADEVGSSVALASSYWNASVLEFEQGRVAEAVPLARRALAAFEVSEDFRNLGRLRGTLGVLLTRLEPPQLAEAVIVLEQSRVELQASGVGRVDMARSSWALADVHFRMGDFDVAQRFLDEADELLEGQDSPVVQASVDVVRGQIAYSHRDVDAARECYVRAVRRLTSIGSDRSAGELWFELAGLLETVGDSAGALTAYKNAAASAGLANRAQVGERPKISAPADPR